jgi:hypothetical protein
MPRHGPNLVSWLDYKFTIFNCDINNKIFLGLEICNWKVGFMNSKENTLFSFLVHLIVRLVIGYLLLGN